MKSILREHLVASTDSRPAGIDAAVLLGRAAYLDPADRRLIEAVLDRGMSATQVAELAAMPAARVRYRIRLLHNHLISRRFVSAMRALSYLDEETSAVLRLHALQRHSVRQIAEELGIGLHAVRKRLTLAEGFLMERAPRQAAPVKA